MGWFGIGGGGKDPNNPLSEIEVPKDQQPAEVQKPASAKDIQKANLAANVGQFDQLADGLSRFSKIVTDLQKEGSWKEAVEIYSMQDKSRQEEFKAAQAERNLEIERLKRGALEENLRHQKEMKKVDHQNAMKRAEYEDQLRQQAKERNMQRELEMQRKQEELKRQTIIFEQEEALKHEEQKAIIHAKAQAKVERENHDLRMEMSRAELKEKKKENEAIAEIKSRNMWKMWTRLFKNEDNMMGNAAFYGGVTAAGLIVIYKVAKVAAQHAQTQLAKPKLIQETSRVQLSSLAQPSFYRSMFNKPKAESKYFFNPQVQEKVEDITLVTKNVRLSNTAHRNVLLFGPPGTGKTMYAKNLAKASGMHYAIMSGGDVAPMGGEGVTELNKTFDWANTNRKGLVLFIDEADAFLRPREEAMSTDLRSAINTFLARTGEPNKRVQIVLATNQIRQLDSAVLDRMNELVEIPLPGHPERTQMLGHYLMHHVFKPANDANQRVKLSDDLVTTVNEQGLGSLASDIADMTEGMSGREIEKMCSNIYASAVSAEDPEITLSKMKKAADDYKSQSTEKAKIRAYREQAMMEGKSY